jgi:hypothetical protein
LTASAKKRGMTPPSEGFDQGHQIEFGTTCAFDVARDVVLEKGIVINGLPIMVREPSYSTMDIDNLDFYYEDCVIRGHGSFVVTIKDRDNFKEAIRTKLLLEVAGRPPNAQSCSTVIARIADFPFVGWSLPCRRGMLVTECVKGSALS